VKWKIEKPELSVDRKGYTIDGKRYVRVTNSLSVIAKNGLMGWYMRVGKAGAEKIIKNRQVLGTIAHSLFEKQVLGKPLGDLDKYVDEIQMDVRLFKNFNKTCILKPDATEQNLWSEKFGYAGTADYFGTYKSNVKWLVHENRKAPVPRFAKGAFVVGDWKTSRDIYDDYWLQLAAYAWAFYERTGIKVAGAFIAQFRNGKIRIKERTWDELMETFEVYKAVLIIYRWKYKNV
jgi:hypothetical protein